MKKRICLIAVLFAIGFLITHTVYGIYLNNFQTYYHVSENLGEKKYAAEDLYKDLKEKSEEYDTEIFVYEDTGNASTYRKFHIYGTQGAIETLKENDIYDLVYTGVDMGRLDIEVSPIGDMKHSDALYEVFYTAKNKDDISVQQLSGYLAKKYGFDDVAEASPDDLSNAALMSFWSITFMVMGLLAYYDIISSRKKNAVTVILGGSIKAQRIRFFRGHLLPVYIIIILYCLMSLWQAPYSHGLKYLLCMVAVFTAFIILLIISMSSVDYRRDLSDYLNIRKLIRMSFCVRLLVSIVTVAVLAVTGISIFKSADLNSQSSFFESHREYDFYMLYDGDGDDTAREFYNEFSSKALGYQKCMNDEPGISENYPVLFVNDNAIREMAEVNDDLAKTLADFEQESCVVLISENQYSEETLAYINRCLDLYDIERPDSKNIVKYDYTISAVLLEDMMNNDGAARSVTKDPVIVIDYYDNDKAVTDAFTSSNDTMYRITDSELKDACSRNGWDYEQLRNMRINAGEGYSLRCSQARSLASAGSVLSTVMIIAQLLISVTVVKLQYRLRSVRMVLEKIMGYSEHRRISGILKVSAVSMAIWITAGVTTGIKADTRAGILICIIALITFIVEIFTVMYGLKKTDAEKMAGILKGASL